MGLRSTFVPIKDQADLTAFLFMGEALEDVSGYGCCPILHGFCVKDGGLWGMFSHDGSTAALFYHVFSPTFSNFKSLEDLALMGQVTPEGAWLGARYLGSWDEVEAFLK